MKFEDGRMGETRSLALVLRKINKHTSPVISTSLALALALLALALLLLVLALLFKIPFACKETGHA